VSAGTGGLLQRSDLPAATLGQNVTSPGSGTAAAALVLLMGEDGRQQLMIRAIAAATARSKEFAKIGTGDFGQRS
jgi:pyrroline-5-carboxylate reductase